MSPSDSNSSDEVFAFKFVYPIQQHATALPFIENDNTSETDEETQLPLDYDPTSSSEMRREGLPLFEPVADPACFCEDFFGSKPEKMTDAFLFCVALSPTSLPSLEVAAPPIAQDQDHIIPVTLPQQHQKEATKRSIPSRRRNPRAKMPLRGQWHRCETGACDSPSGFMICCDTCGSWLHALCQGVSPGEATQLSEFVCLACRHEKDRKNADNKKRKKDKQQKKEKKKRGKGKRKRDRKQKEKKKKDHKKAKKK